MIGGIDLNVEEAIDDPSYPDAGFGYDPFYIDAGWQHLNGSTALKYARTRATPGSDLDRVKRQQQVILTVRDKLLREKRVPQLLTQIGSLLAMYSGSIQTNLTPGQLGELIEFAAGIDRDKIYAVTLGEQAIEEYLTPDGQDAIVLKPGAAQRIRDQLYHAPLTPGAPSSSSPILIAPAVPLMATATSTRRTCRTGSPPARRPPRDGSCAMRPS